MSGMNGLRGVRRGQNRIQFRDGTVLEYQVPNLIVDGLAMGNRILNFDGQFEVVDRKNNLTSTASFCYMKTQEAKEQGFGSKLFGFFGGGKKQEPIPHDHMTFKIEREGKTVCEGNGAWTGQIYWEGKRYWSFDDDFEPWEQEKLFLLESDTTKRKDLIALQTPNNYKEAQIAHDDIRRVEKDDQFFRETTKR